MGPLSPSTRTSPHTNLVFTSTPQDRSLVDTPSSFSAGVPRMVRTTGSSRILGTTSGVTMALSRLLAATTSAELKARSLQELQEPQLCKCGVILSIGLHSATGFSLFSQLT